MKEKSIVRHLNVTFENDGSAHINGRVEIVLLDDTGAIVAIKPDTFPISARLEADDAFAVAVREAGIKAHVDAFERARQDAEKAAADATKAADDARLAAEATTARA